MISAWPPKYLEQECITRSAPNSKGLCNNNKRKYVSILICSSVLIHKVSQCPRTTCDFGTKKISICILKIQQISYLLYITKPGDRVRQNHLMRGLSVQDIALTTILTVL